MKHSNCLSIGIAVLALCAQTTLSSGQEVPALTVQEDGSEPVASINGKVVTKDELTSFAIQLENFEGARSAGGEPLLNEYILTKLYNEIPTSATLAADESASTAPTKYSQVSQRSLLKRELRNWMSENIDVPRSAMEEWYTANVEKYKKPERIHAWHIFMETSDDTPSSSPETVRAKLQNLKQQIDAGTSFSATAKEHSEAASGETGGEIGKITRRMPIGPLSKPMNLELENALFALTPGKVSDVVDTRHGMHLLYVTEKETTRTPTLEDMITSGILPGAVAQDRLTSEMRGLVQDTVAQYNGQALPGGDENVTTDTVAFRFDGKDFTIRHLISMFGPRFANYLETTRTDPQALKSLMEQALEDQAMVRAAVDKGLAEKPEIARELDLFGQREQAQKHIAAIIDAETKVTEEQIQSKYNELKDQLRQPEAEGAVVVVESNEATGTAEQARAREMARRKAEEILDQLKIGDFNKVAEELKSETDFKITVTRIPRHVVGQSTDTEARVFDQAISMIQLDSGLSEVMPLSDNFAIAKLEKRYPGEPLPLDQIKDRLVAMLEQQARTAVREQMVDRLEAKGLVKYLPGASDFGKIDQSTGLDNGTTGTR